MTSIPRVCWPGSPITRSPNWPRCCLGIGATRSLSPTPLDHDGAGFRSHHQPCRRTLSKDQQTIAFALPEMEYLRERLRSRKVHPRCLERTAHRGALRPQTAYWSPMEEIKGNTFQREIKYNPSTRDEKPSPEQRGRRHSCSVLAGFRDTYTRDDWRNCHQEHRWRELGRYRRYQLDGGATSRRYKRRVVLVVS